MVSNLPLPLFRNSDERDDAGHRLSVLRQATEALAVIRHDPDVADYRLGAAGDEKPLLPTQDELDTARLTIERVLDCLRHSYNRRCRYDDDPARTGPEIAFEDEGGPW